VPESPKIFSDISDYNVLGGPINGLYLTPISSTENKFRDIVKGEYHDWARIIERAGVPDQFPLRWATLALGVENECIFLSDHDREHASPSP
jgi:hypothetical protein